MLLGHPGFEPDGLRLGIGLFDRLHNARDQIRRVVRLLARVVSLLGERLRMKVVSQSAEIERAGVRVGRGQQDVFGRNAGLFGRQTARTRRNIR